MVFTGGIGEHDGKSRAEILHGLEDYGVMLDTTANEATGDNLRSVSANSQVVVWWVTAQEDRMIAVHVGQMESEEEL